MKELVKFELRNFIKRKKNIVAICILFILLLAYVLFSMQIESKVLSSNKTYEQSNLESAQQELILLKSELERLKDNKDAVTHLKKNIEDAELKIDLKSGIIQAMNTNDWRKQLKLQIELDEVLLRQVKAKQIIGPSENELLKNISKNKYLSERDIKPIVESFSMESLNFIRLITKDIFPLVLAIFIFILCSDVVSKEFEEGTYKILFTQPISRKKVLLAKFLTYYLVTLLLVLSMVLIIFLLLGLTKGFGDLNYPIEYFKGNTMMSANIKDVVKETAFITMREFIKYAGLFYLIYILFLVSFSMLASTLFSSSSSSISFAILIYVTTVTISTKMAILNPIAHLIPFTFNNFDELFSGNLITRLGNGSATMMIGGIVLPVFILVNYLISNRIIYKRDMA